MEKVRIKVKDKSYIIDVACEDTEKTMGLQNRDSLPDKRGMLFVFDNEQAAMWMKDTYIALDLIYIDVDDRVKAVHYGEPLSEELIIENNVNFVLEVNANSGIEVGDKIDLSDYYQMIDDKEEDEDPDFDEEAYDFDDYSDIIEEEISNMLVLDETGKIQMELAGGERIFSRKNTKTLISMAKRAYKNKTESDYKRLGKKVFQFLAVQDGNEPQHVEIKSST